DLGIRAAPVLVRLQRLAVQAAIATRHVANVLCDEPVELSLPDAQRPASVRIERVAPAVGGERPVLAAVEPTGRFRPPSAAAGLYRVTDPAASGASGVLASYAVNLRPQETDGERIADDQALAAFDPHTALILHSPDE